MAGVYNPVDFQRQDTRRVQQQDIGVASPQVNAPVVIDNEREMLAGLASEIAKGSSALMNKALDISIENAYLEGAAEVGSTQSEAELQADPLTRDWKVAGFRDTTAKFAIADAEAQLNYDMADGVRLREQDPKAMQQYLNARRNKLLPTLQGMSGQQRTQAMVKLALSDRAAIAQHRADHTAFIVDTKLQAIGASLNTNLSLLTQSKAKLAIGALDPQDYNKKIASVAGSLGSDIWGDTSLPYEVRQKMTMQALEQTLASDNVDLYDFLDQTEFEDERLGTATLTQRLQPEDQVKLAGKYREAMTRSEALRTMAANKQLALMTSDMENDRFNGTYKDAESFADAMLANKAMSGSEYITFLKKARDWANRSQTNNVLASAYLSGDRIAIDDLAKSEADGVNAVERMLKTSGATPEQRMSTWLDAGAKGMPTAYKKVGEMLETSLSQMELKDSPMLPEHIKSLDSVMTIIADKEASGEYNTRINVLSGLSDSKRLRMERMLELHRTGLPLQGALNMVLAREATEASVTPTARAASSVKLKQDVFKQVDDLDSRSFLDTLGLNVSSLWNTQDAAKLKIAPSNEMGSRDGWFSDSDTVRYYESIYRGAVKDEAEHVMLVGYQDTPKAVMNAAMAGVAARTVQTKQGPLILPRGVDLQRVFGVGPGNQANIGKALDVILKQTKEDARYRLSFAQGTVFAQEYDKNGVPIGMGMNIAPKDVRAALDHIETKADLRNNDLYGAGTLATLGSASSEGFGKGDGISFRYNGDNNAAVGNDWMFEFRSKLVEHELVRTTPYKDASGKKDAEGNPIMTAGVGVSSHNPYYPKVGADGKVAVEDIRSSFLGASNAAAKAGRLYTEQTGLKGKEWFLLFSELSYQSGDAFLTQKNPTGNMYRDFVAKAQSGDKEAAIEAFKKTAAWYYSANRKQPSKLTKRQQDYLNLINNAMKGK